MTFTLEDPKAFARAVMELRTVLVASQAATRQTNDPKVLKACLIELGNTTARVLGPVLSNALDEHHRQQGKAN